MEKIELFSPLTLLSGIGPSRAKQLEKLGIETVYDLLTYFPRTYEDRTKRVKIAGLQPDEPACFEATVVSQPTIAHIRKGMDITRVRVADETGKLTLTFFNQNFVKEQLIYGQDYLFFGTLKSDYGLSMTAPVFERIDAAGTVTDCILPVYGLTAGISNKMLLGYVRQALSACVDNLPELLPKNVREKYDLLPVAEGYAAIHQPQDFVTLQQARRRLVFEEFFIFSAGLCILRQKSSAQAVASYQKLDLSAFYASVPFSLTNAQQAAISDILRDFSSGRQMNRLVQGDVGSGKTMIAAAACFCAIQNGHQAAFMAPTEILAEQHYKTLSSLLSPLGITVGLLTGSMTAKKKNDTKAAILSGKIQLIIGTHALLTEDTFFRNLGLVIADEQHRFGVAQRAALIAKGCNPHLLVMSATPIPRTLALLAYGDLDISVVNELPPGRLPVKTYLVGEDMRARINAFIRKQCEAGNQVYIVCPAVEESDDDTLKAAEVWAEALKKTVFPDLRVGLLHGRMKGAEKEEILHEFSSHNLDILVCTTVVEVGVDVPNATLMVIENAERFGLSQLHQLRGRVGRGSAQAYCVLFSGTKNAETRLRLQTLTKTNDGFKIAEADLAQRGPGDFFGSRQSGLPLFKMASLQMDMETLQQAQTAAAEVIQNADSLNTPELAPLRARVEHFFEVQTYALN